MRARATGCDSSEVVAAATEAAAAAAVATAVAAVAAVASEPQTHLTVREVVAWSVSD